MQKLGVTHYDIPTLIAAHTSSVVQHLPYVDTEDSCFMQEQR